MIKGAFVFAAGLAVGTIYGVVYGITLGTKGTKFMNVVAEKIEADLNKKEQEDQVTITTEGSTV